MSPELEQAATATGTEEREQGGDLLTEAQEGLWFAQRLDPGNPIFNTGQVVEIHGVVDAPAWQAAVEAALREADGLAISVVDQGELPRQVVDERRRACPRVVDLRHRDDAEQEAWRQIDCDQRTPLDPTRDPLVAELLFLIGDRRAVWYQRAHHLVLDGYGTALLTRRICEIYSATVTGDAVEGGPFGSYAAVLREDREYRTSERRAADAAFWRQQVEGKPEATGLKPGNAVTSRTAHRYRVPLSPALSDRASGSVLGTPSWPDALVALAAAYVARHSNTDEVVIGVPSLERLGRAAARVPATTMNVLPVRIAIDEDAPVAEYVEAVAGDLRRHRRHGRYRAEQLRRDLGLVGLERRLHGALINVLPFAPIARMAGVTASVTVLSSGPIDDLTMTVRADESGRPAVLELEANPALYTESEVRAHGHRLAAFLDASARAVRLADVETATPDELASIVKINSTEHPVPDTTLTALLEQAMARTPSAPALVHETPAHEIAEWSYAELDRRTAQLRDVLVAAGVRRGDVVAVAIPRSAELVASLVAIVRAGAAYLPLDVGHPAGRLAQILRSARPRVVLASGEMAARLTSDVLIVTLDASWDLPSPPAAVAVEPPAPGDAAYVIYTSGSTGQPKGVVIEHRAIVNRLEWMRTQYGFGPDDRVLQKTPATFDVSVWEFFLSFISGGTLVVAPAEAHKDPAWLASLIRAHAITTLHFVPSMLAIFVEEPSAAGLRIRRIFCSGEALPASLRDRCHQTLTAELHNLYGPTEAAVDVTYWDASAGDRSVPVPIGWPVWNTRMYVLDRRLRHVPPGASGDLYIAGVQLAREYLGRPDLTAERFVADPFVRGERMYHTGDVAQWRDDGAIVFLGRSDHQVKIRGLRIELGEIEAVLGESPEVAHVAVIPRELAPGDTQLVAYVVPRVDTLDVAALRAYASRVLPDYMVPSAFVTIDELPLSRSGKLDRAALPAPVMEGARSGRPPATPTEARVAAIFADVLPSRGTDRPTLSADDDFFALGGHSLLAARVMARVRQEWSCTLALGVIFAHPTVAKLAREIELATGASSRTSAAGRDDGLQPLLTLTTAPRAAGNVFCLHPAGGLSWCYGPLARSLGDTFNVYGLQAPGLNPDVELPERLEELIADYVRRIRRVQPEGPYHLVGWSIGGIIGHGIAVALQEDGAAVGTLALLDAYPSDRWRAQPEPEEGAALRALLLIAGHDADVLPAPLTREAVIAFLRECRHPLGELPDAALNGIVRVVQRNNQLVRAFYHRRYRGDVTFFRAALDHTGDGLRPEQWTPYVDGAVDSHDVESRHSHLTGAAATAVIAPILRGVLRS